jgi:hypothetical protein
VKPTATGNEGLPVRDENSTSCVAAIATAGLRAARVCKNSVKTKSIWMI